MFGQGSQKAAVHVKESTEDNRSKTMQNEGCTVKAALVHTGNYAAKLTDLFCSIAPLFHWREQQEITVTDIVNEGLKKPEEAQKKRQSLFFDGCYFMYR